MRNRKLLPQSIVCCRTHRYKDGIELRTGGKYRIVEDDDKVQLLVRGVDKDGRGRCHMRVVQQQGQRVGGRQTPEYRVRTCSVSARHCHTAAFSTTEYLTYFTMYKHNSTIARMVGIIVPALQGTV